MGSRSLDLGAVSALIERIYDAALDPQLWQPVLGGVARLFRAHAGAIVIAPADGLEPRTIETLNIDPDIHAEFAQRRDLEDIWCQATQHDVSGSIRTGTELVPAKKMRTTAYYHEVLAPAETEWMLGGTIERTKTLEATFSVLRPRSAEDFCVADKRHFRELMPHLRRACVIHERLSASLQREVQLEEALYRSNQAVVILDTSGHVAYHNETAGLLLSHGDGLSIRGGVLRAKDPKADDELGAAISRALLVTKQRETATAEALRIPRPSGKLSYQLMVAPVGPRASMRSPSIGPGCILLLSDPVRRHRLSADTLRVFFDLTPAQANLCEALQDDLTLREAAGTVGISVNTAKTHLARAFEKCGVRSRGALLALFSGSQ